MSRGFSDGFSKAKKDGKDSLSFSDKAKLIASNLKSGVSILLDGKTVNGSVVEGISFSPEIPDISYTAMHNVSVMWSATGDNIATVLETNTETRAIHFFCNARTNDLYGINLRTEGTALDNTYNAWANLELHDKVGNSIILTGSYYSGIQPRQPANNIEIKDFILIINDRKVLFNWFDYDNLSVVTGSEKFKSIDLPAGFVLTNGVRLVIRAQNNKAHASFLANAYLSGSASSHKFKVFAK